MPDPQLIDLIARGGAVTLLAIMIVALLNEWVYTRGRFKELEKDRNFWRRVALKGKGALVKAEEELDSELGE
jgi:hypothetical protein